AGMPRVGRGRWIALLPTPLFSEKRRAPEGQRMVAMVLGTFAETKVPRRAGATNGQDCPFARRSRPPGRGAWMHRVKPRIKYKRAEGTPLLLTLFAFQKVVFVALPRLRLDTRD
ncbi:MAG TPA: hypothetical protein VI457_07570, partial [Methylococcaceae bacterium]|nr:hypothetical protein [Methylococcaceae bacterium]